MKSIKQRLVKHFVFVVVISVLILEVALINLIKQYYYHNTETILTNQIKVAAEFYERYFANISLEENVLEDVDIFWRQTPAQVQVIDCSGYVLMDSIGILPQEKLASGDVKKALGGAKGYWVGNVDYQIAKVMAVTYPLKSDEQIVGAIRFITSLQAVDAEIKTLSTIFLGIGLAVILIIIALSVFLANSIVEPLREVTAAAAQMADGNYAVRCRKKYDDETGKLAETLNQMATEIQRQNQLKNEFICSVSHELRTPLTSIKGWAVVLRGNGTNSSATLQEGLGIIEKESDRLTVMVEELLDFSKFVSGKSTLNKTVKSIENLLGYIQQQLSPRAEREGVHFLVDCEAGLPLILIDENRMKQVLINLLDNAFKFTSPGETVKLTAAQEATILVLRVIDNGCGISKEDLPKVKEKFYKGKSNKSQNGIGLSICDEIVKMHGGSLEILSELDKGTEVIIKLPLH